MKHFFITIIICCGLNAIYLSTSMQGQTNIAPGDELRVSVDSVTVHKPELAVSNDGVVWVLWGNAGRWINPNLVFDGLPMVDAGNLDTGEYGSNPVSLPDGKWMKIDTRTVGYHTGLREAGQSHYEIQYFYRTYIPLPDQSLPNLVVNEEVYDWGLIMDYDKLVKSIRTQNQPDKILILTSRFILNDSYSDFRFNDINKSNLQMTAPSNLQLKYDDYYVSYLASGFDYLHDVFFSPVKQNAFVGMQRQKVRLDSGAWMVDRYRRNIARYNDDGQIRTPWVTLDTLELSCIDQAYQLLLHDTSTVWICGREIHGSRLLAEEWSFAGQRGRMEFLVNNVKYNGMECEYQILPRPRGGYVLVWTGVEADSSTDVYMVLLDDSMNKISVPCRINDERHGNQYHPSITIKDDTLYTVWHDERNGTRQVYFKRTPLDLVTHVRAIPIPPEAFILEQNYPNPFGTNTFAGNPSTTISYGLPKESNVELKVYTMLGQEVATIVNESQSEGWHTVTFNAANLPGGMYVYRLRAGNSVLSKTMVITK